MTTKVFGISLSPFVRKVLITLDIFNVEYENIPLTPMDLPDDFKQISPLGKIPALQDDDITVSDSSVICGYLDAKYGAGTIYPTALVQRTKAHWFEEYADSKLAELCGGLFFERIVKPLFLKQETDQEWVTKTIEENLPVAMDYLNSVVPDEGFMVGDFSIADIALGSMFLNAKYAQWEVDAERWPAVAAYVGRLFNHETFQKRMVADAKMMNQ